MGIKNYKYWINFFREIFGRIPFSFSNILLPQNISSEHTSNSGGFGESLFFIDLTQLLPFNKKNFNEEFLEKEEINKNKQIKKRKRTIEFVYDLFERSVISKICTQLCGINGSCFFCGSELHFYGDWAVVQKTSKSQKNTSNNSSAICRCTLELSLSQLLAKLTLRETDTNNSSQSFSSHNIKIKLLYDNRNINPLCRSLTSMQRYNNKNKLSVSDKEEFCSILFSNPKLRDVLKYGLHKDSYVPSKNELEGSGGKDSVTKGDKEGDDSLEEGEDKEDNVNEDDGKIREDGYNFESANELGDSQNSDEMSKSAFLQFFKNRYQYLVLETCIYILVSKIHRYSVLMNYTTNFDKFHYEWSSGVTLTIDAIPDRIIQLLKGQSDREVLSTLFAKELTFQNRTFCEQFFDLYCDAVGTSTWQISALKRWTDNSISDYISSNKSFGNESRSSFGSSVSYVNLGASKNVCFSMSSGRREIQLYGQDMGSTKYIGESDLKIVPYILQFVEFHLVSSYSKNCSGKKLIWIDSGDSDLVLILLCVLLNIFKLGNEGPFSIKEVCWLFENESPISMYNNLFELFKNTFCIVMDMGVKKNSASAMIEIEKSIRLNEEHKNRQKLDFSTLLRQTPYVTPSDKSLDTLFDTESTHVSSNNDNCSGNNGDDDPTLKKKSKPKEGNPRFVDVLTLFDMLNAKFSKEMMLNLFLYIIWSGGDYTVNPPLNGGKKMTDFFREYVNYNKLNGINPIALIQKNATDGLFEIDECSLLHFGISAYIFWLPNNHFRKLKVQYKTKYSILSITPTATKSISDLKNIYESLYKDVKKLRPDQKILTVNELISEVKRCSWVFNYYLGNEYIRMQSCEMVGREIASMKKVSSSISKWGWTIIPQHLDPTLSQQFSSESINSLQGVVSWVKNVNVKLSTSDDDNNKNKKIEDNLFSLLNQIKTSHFGEVDRRDLSILFYSCLLNTCSKTTNSRSLLRVIKENT